tara:strand:- start:129 stop:470 length:342 start_codon:yes stop_codon:yes gene_type:complete
MKKLTLSVAAIALSLNMSAQTKGSDELFTQVSYKKIDVIEMINTIDEILFWNSEDAAECKCCNHGSFHEGWGSNYWLTIIRNELAKKITAHGQVNDYLYEEDFVNCENCDEID